MGNPDEATDIQTVGYGICPIIQGTVLLCRLYEPNNSQNGLVAKIPFGTFGVILNY